MALKIVLAGALGRMGLEIANVIFSDDAVKLHAALEYPGHPDIGKDYGACAGKGNIGIPVLSSIDSVDLQDSVIIDFTTPKASRALLEKIADKNGKIVIGTTGMGKDELDFAGIVAKKIPVMISPNMSLGVNLLFVLTQMVTKSLKDQFDIEIIEAHHRFKKDSPSGTAKKLGEIIAQEIGLSYDEAVQNGREGISDSNRPKKEIGMHAVRGGDIVGDHTVLFAGMGERIELKHMAHSRSTFAHGAVTAAKWLALQGAGLYSMRDVLGL
ncbi:MAG: 4-hydroxy-tetrahydrodipicolinate reductase [Fibrobacter sp.]|nr:4-hydroxy-tetrahydrodipicolinate reductase [Fibrobacter sp.]